MGCGEGRDCVVMAGRTPHRLPCWAEGLEPGGDQQAAPRMSSSPQPTGSKALSPAGQGRELCGQPACGSPASDLPAPGR